METYAKILNKMGRFNVDDDIVEIEDHESCEV